MKAVARPPAALKNLGIQPKLFLAFTLLIIVPLYLLRAQIYHRSSEIIRSESRNHLEYAAYQTCVNIDLMLDKILDLVFKIQTDTTIQEILSSAAAQAPLTEWQRRAYTEQLNQVLVRHSFASEVAHVSIVADAGIHAQIFNATADQNDKLLDMDRIRNGKGSVVWFGYNGATDTILLGAQINSIRTQQPLGYVLMNVSQKSFGNLFNQMEYSHESEQFIVDQGDRFISSNRSIETLRVPGSMLRGLDRSRYFGFYDDREAGTYVVYRSLQKAPWTYAMRVPTEFIEQPLSLLYSAIILLEIVIIAAALMLAILFSSTISRPIRQLTGAMRRFSEGDMDIRCKVQSTNEIGQIGERFNEMVVNINILIEKYEQEILSKQQAELKSLRMQINPHFLYNTLETINWMARIKDAPDIGIVTKSLGDLMRTTISGDALLTLGQELTTLGNYISIQKFRYQDKIAFDIRVPPALHPCCVPKLILQPIVENAIVHGLKNKAGGGTVCITAQAHEEVLCITIRDDGVGISPGKIERLLDGEAGQDDHTHIGLQNVDARIKIRYGEAFGVTIQSEEGAWTEVSLRLPVRGEFEN